MSGITTHVLDLETGKPAAGMAVLLEVHRADRGWVRLGERATDACGRVADLIAEGALLDTGHYRFTFETGEYLRRLGDPAFYPEVTVVFEVRDPGQHYHIPLLLSPYGYSTYRGS